MLMEKMHNRFGWGKMLQNWCSPCLKKESTGGIFVSLPSGNNRQDFESWLTAAAKEIELWQSHKNQKYQNSLK